MSANYTLKKKKVDKRSQTLITDFFKPHEESNGKIITIKNNNNFNISLSNNTGKDVKVRIIVEDGILINNKEQCQLGNNCPFKDNLDHKNEYH